MVRSRTREITYEYPTECTGKSGGGEEESDTVMLLISSVPHAQIKDDSGEETTLGNTEEEAGGEESGVILGDAHQSTDDTPCKGEGWEPQSGGGEFEDDVTWDLEQDVADEVDGQRVEVLVPGLFQTGGSETVGEHEQRGENVLMWRSVTRPSIRAFPTERG